VCGGNISHFYILLQKSEKREILFSTGATIILGYSWGAYEGCPESIAPF